jgi:hypothetical protein
MEQSQPPGITPITLVTPNIQPGGIVPKPAMRKRIATFKLYEPYEDFTVTAWVNFPQRLLRDGQTEDERLAALSEIVLAHDLVDFDGNPYPPANDPAFWREIPQDVAAVIIQSIQGQMGRLDPTKPAN